MQVKKKKKSINKIFKIIFFNSKQTKKKVLDINPELAVETLELADAWQLYTCVTRCAAMIQSVCFFILMLSLFDFESF